MLNIHIDFDVTIEDRIQYLNYLAYWDFQNVSFKYLKKDIWMNLHKQGLILIPKVKAFQKITFWDKFHIRNIQKTITKDLWFLEKYFYIIKVMETSLSSLDQTLSPVFKNSNNSGIDPVFVFTEKPELQQFNEVVLGIDLSDYKYFPKSDVSTFNKEVFKYLVSLGDPTLKTLLFHYKLGCTALNK